jgi:hypothetical protein
MIDDEFRGGTEMPEGTAVTRKWWLEATYVTAFSAAIIVPGVALLDHCSDYRLETAKQEHAVDLDKKKQSLIFLDRAWEALHRRGAECSMP